MATSSVNGSGSGARSGAQTLALLAAPLNVLVLRALADGPRRLADLRREAGSPAQTTLRAQLKRLVAIGAIEKRRRDRFPGTLEYEMTRTGRDLTFVVDVLERWLTKAPAGPLAIGSNEAKAPVKALADSWSATMLRALAPGARTLTELDRVIAALNYPSLERRLSALRLAGLAEAKPGNGRGTPYALTEWLRQGIAPLVAAAQWERRHQPLATAPVGRLDAETAFLLAMPLLVPPTASSGSCRLAVDFPDGSGSRLGGVVVEVTDGEIVACVTRLQEPAGSWALGSLAAWFSAVIEGDVDRLELGGDRHLASALLDCLHASLFGARAQAAT